MGKRLNKLLMVTAIFGAGFGAGKCNLTYQDVKQYFTGAKKRTEQAYKVAQETHDTVRPYVNKAVEYFTDEKKEKESEEKKPTKPKKGTA